MVVILSTARCDTYRTSGWRITVSAQGTQTLMTAQSVTNGHRFRYILREDWFCQTFVMGTLQTSEEY